MPGTCPVGQEVEMEDNYREVKKAEPCLKLIHMDQVEVEEIEWLFYPFIPYGKVTIIQGDPGEGKTTVVLQIIAKLTKGEAILSETSEGKSEEAGVEPINVIYQTAEDGLGDTIKPRLLAAGADCSRVLVIDDQDQPLTMVDARLEEAIIQTKARLVVLDPIQGFLGAGVDMHRANEIRPLMKRISVLAEKYQCAIILIGHMNKNSNGKSSYRGLGSIDFQAAARSVLIVGRVKDEPEIRVICHVKSSLAPEGDAIAFRLDKEKGFHWITEFLEEPDIRGGSDSESESIDGDNMLFIKPDEANAIILKKGVAVTGYGIVEGKLHIQVRFSDILNTDNHGYVYLKNEDGKVVNCQSSVAFWDQSHVNSYEEFVFEVSAEELVNYEIWGEFWTCNNAPIEGEWQVTFPVEKNE